MPSQATEILQVSIYLVSDKVYAQLSMVKNQVKDIFVNIYYAGRAREREKTHANEHQDRRHTVSAVSLVFLEEERKEFTS